MSLVECRRNCANCTLHSISFQMQYEGEKITASKIQYNKNRRRWLLPIAYNNRVFVAAIRWLRVAMMMMMIMKSIPYKVVMLCLLRRWCWWWWCCIQLIQRWNDAFSLSLSLSRALGNPIQIQFVLFCV